MGIRDLFSRNKGVKSDKKDEILQQDMILNYNPDRNKGITSASVGFGNIENVEGKFLKRVSIRYSYNNGDGILLSEDGVKKFSETRNVYVEPIYVNDKNGKAIDETEKYYKELILSGKINDVKGFFRIQDVDAISTRDNGSEYIGSLKYRQDGKPTRCYDEEFKKRYVESLKQKSELKNNLNSQVYSSTEVYQSWLNNEDARLRGEYNLKKDKMR